MRPEELTKAEAQRRIHRALEHIQRAQTEIGHAMSDLSSLIGGETPNEKYRCATCGAEWEV